MDAGREDGSGGGESMAESATWEGMCSDQSCAFQHFLESIKAGASPLKSYSSFHLPRVGLSTLLIKEVVANLFYHCRNSSTVYLVDRHPLKKVYFHLMRYAK